MKEKQVFLLKIIHLLFLLQTRIWYCKQPSNIRTIQSETVSWRCEVVTSRSSDSESSTASHTWQARIISGHPVESSRNQVKDLLFHLIPFLFLSLSSSTASHTWQARIISGHPIESSRKQVKDLLFYLIPFLFLSLPAPPRIPGRRASSRNTQ